MTGGTNISEDDDDEQDRANSEYMNPAPDAGITSDTADEPSPEWNSACIVKQKMIFSKSPMPVVGKR